MNLNYPQGIITRIVFRNDYPPHVEFPVFFGIFRSEKLDTGSQVNILPQYMLRKLNIKTTLKQPNYKLSAYNGNPLDTLGCCMLKCRYTDKSQVIDFYVVNTSSTPILGLRSCLDFGLIRLVYSVQASNIARPMPITKASVLKEYADIFKGIGLFPEEYNITLDPSIPPVVNPPRRVPLALRDRLKAELDRIVSMDIIAKVTEPTPWVNSLVVVEKPRSGKLRVCLDPQSLNRAIQRPHYPSRTFEDILPELSKARYFTKLDARSGYWAIRLSEASSFFTTFNTPFCRFRYLRCPFGLNSSQDEFQRRMDECYEGPSGVVAIVDDVLVSGETRQEHDQNLRP